MKNQKTNNKPTGLKKKIALEKDRKAKLAGKHLKDSKSDELLVMRDPYSKKDYYMSRRIGVGQSTIQAIAHLRLYLQSDD